MTQRPDWQSQMLAAVPDHILDGNGSKQLARWFEERGWRPSLIEVCEERTRRRELKNDD